MDIFQEMCIDVIPFDRLLILGCRGKRFLMVTTQASKVHTDI